jgi:hypothetical protein
MVLRFERFHALLSQYIPSSSGDHRFELCHSGYNIGHCACWDLQRPNHTIATGGADRSPTNSGVRPVDVLSADLTRAEALDAEGNKEECLPAARGAAHYLVAH